MRAAITPPPPPGVLTDTAAGAALLGYFLTAPAPDPAARDQLARQVLDLDTALLSSTTHREVLTTLQRLARRGEPLHAVLVTAELQRRGSTVTASAVAELADPDQAAPTPGPFVRILEECRQRRALHALGGWLAAAVLDRSQPVDELVDRARRHLGEVARTGRLVDAEAGR
jgi:replicative DNA helicase